MGVPSFYKWLVSRYPNTVVKAIEEEGESAGVADSTSRNPNGLEFDNLYLDMNGIIHPCFHPEDHPSPPSTYEDVFKNVCAYIDRIFSIVRPRKLMFMAIDGVAPRAKMNQQRTRRFRASKDNEIVEAEERRLRNEFELAGKPLLPKQESKVSDSNIITPGTKFMDDLSKALQLYINQRLVTHGGWKNIKVILSDANVPGEGEHKIMLFIRLQRASPGYDPNTRHCLYGLDADLIMLALATHEVHFSILREDILVQETSAAVKKPYQFLHVWILREYLELDLEIVDPPLHVKIDLERLIDDFIFMCFFTGNDFLPHMPTLEIREGAIDLLMHVYVKEFKSLGGYLVDTQWAGYAKGRFIRLKRVEKFILTVGSYEERIFKKRSEIRERILKRLLSQYSDDKEEEEEEQERDPDMELQHCASTNVKAPTSSLNIEIKETKNSASSIGRTTHSSNEILQNTIELKEKLKSYIRGSSDLFKNGSAVDRVKLGTIGFKERYYREKFSAESKEDIETMRKKVVERYTEGLCWVILYYFSGVPSWKWFYPYHYGPFASDLRGLSQVKLNFEKGLPFKPFDQLMGVLPPRSALALPKVYQHLMTREEIMDFYPTNLELDVEGKRFTWQAICKLPFVDEELLLSETRKVEAELDDDEAERNKTKLDILFVRGSNEHLGSRIFLLYRKQTDGKETDTVKESIGTDSSCGICGFISPCNGPLSNFDEDVLCVQYELPYANPHIPRPLAGVNPPDKTISEHDIVERQLWHEYHGTRPCNWLGSQESRRTVIAGTNSGLTNSASGGIYKGAGYGWGGRGNSQDYSFESERSTKFPIGHRKGIQISSSSSGGHVGSSSSGRDSREHNAYPVNYRRTTNFAENRKSLGIGQFEGKRLEELRISDSRQPFNSFGRARTGNTDYMSYGNNSAADRSRYNWRQSSYAQPVGPPLGHGWRQSSSTVQGSSTPNTSHNVWRPNQSPPSAPSMLARGRGRFVPNAATSDWKLRDTPDSRK